MRWPRVAAVATVADSTKVSAGSVASLLTATMRATDVGTAADHDVTQRGQAATIAARDVITTAAGTAITATGAVIATTGSATKSSQHAPSLTQLSPVDTF